MDDGQTVKTTQLKLFRILNKFSFICALPNFINEDTYLPPFIVRYHSIYTRTANIILVVFVIIENASFLTQKNLTDKQTSDLITLGVSHFFLLFYYVSMSRNRLKVRKILYSLTVSLKKIYNDEEIEKAAVKKSKLYVFLFLSLCSGALFTYGLEAFVLVVCGEGKFITVITGWPDVDDDSVSANIARVVFYVLWWLFMIRVMALYQIVVISAIYLGFQFQQLQSYFFSLVKIFDENLSQADKEVKYERALKTGIRLHSETLRCTRYSQEAFHVAFCGQILINTMTLVLVLIRLMTYEHNLMNLLASGVMGTAILTGTGLFMWNLGDITVEAGKVPIAIYCSGWENCTAGASSRVRRLVSFSMLHGQKRVSIQAMGVVELSYTSYVTVVKSAYSVFSVFY